MRSLTRDHVLVVALLLLAFVVDRLLTEGEFAPIVYAVPMLVAAHTLSPRATLAVCVAGLVMATVEGFLTPEPLQVDLVRWLALAIIAFTTYLLAARIRIVQDRDIAQRNTLAAMLRVRDRIVGLERGESSNGQAEVAGPPEARDLADAFNRMAREIRTREEALRESEEKFRALFHNASDAIFLHTLTPSGEPGPFTEVNDIACRRLGYSREELLALTPGDIDAQEWLPEAERVRQEVLAPGRGDITFEMVHVAKDGHHIPVEISSHLFILGGQTVALSIARDISARKRAERILLEAREQLEAKVASRSTDLHIVSQRLRSEQEGHEQTEQERASLQAELQGVNQELVSAGVRAIAEADKAARRAEELAATVATLTSIAEGVLIYDSEGKIVGANPAAQRMLGFSAAELTLPLVEQLALVRIESPEGKPLPPESLPPAIALSGGVVQGAVLQVHLPNGGIVWVSASAARICTGDGKPLGAVVTLTDITRLRQLQEQQEDFVRSISHDLRQPLTVVMGMLGWLWRRHSRQAQGREADAAGRALASAERMNSMIQELVESIRLESGTLLMHKVPSDLLGLIDAITDRLSTDEERARIQVEAPAPLPPVPVDVDRLERAIVNLVTNALKYSAATVPVVIGVGESGGEATIAVSDKGVGIPAEDIPHLCERFYRASTGVKSEGLGLGLYVTRMIVEAHGGRLSVQSTVGKGSTFTIALPISG